MTTKKKHYIQLSQTMKFLLKEERKKTRSLFNTEPLRKKLDIFLDEAEFKKDSDLPFNSDIITFNDRKLKTFWINSK